LACRNSLNRHTPTGAGWCAQPGLGAFFRNLTRWLSPRSRRSAQRGKRYGTTLGRRILLRNGR
jgi:hypothetical protein